METRRSNQFTGVVSPDNLVHTWLWIVIQVEESVNMSSFTSNVTWLRMTELFLQNTVYLRVAFLSTDSRIEWRKSHVIHVSCCRKLQFPCQTQSCADHLYCGMVATHSRLTAFAKHIEMMHGLYYNVVVTYLQRIEIFSMIGPDRDPIDSISRWSARRSFGFVNALIACSCLYKLHHLPDSYDWWILPSYGSFLPIREILVTILSS